MSRQAGVLSWIVAVLLCCLIPGKVNCERVLILTTDQFNTPFVSTPYSGLYAFTDLVGAGLPFDVRTYSRFLTLDLSPYDVIILNGHTSPVPVEQVAQRCEAAMAAGKRVFINGYRPYRCYDSTGTTYDEVYYADRLFGVPKGPDRLVTAVPVMPPSLQKDAELAALGVAGTYIGTFAPASPFSAEITLGGHVICFIGPDGGALKGHTEYEHNLLDYGKLVNYIRHGDATIVGFANDRIDGKPVVAWHVDCHVPSDPVAVDSLLSLAEQHGIPLDNTLTYQEITPAGAAKWNSVTNSLMAIGGHSRTHPQDWPSLPDVLYESTEAIEDQRGLIPNTIDFFSASGAKNLTSAQLDQVYQTGVLFDGQGQGRRKCRAPDGTYIDYQIMPTNAGWLRQLATCEYTPTWPAETTYSDNVIWNEQGDFQQSVSTHFQQNVKYGMYTYGYFHDTFLHPNTTKYVNGIPMCVYIHNAMQWLHDQDVQFIFAHDLNARLQDYIAGDVDYVSNPDDSITITVTRPDSLANVIKIGFKGDQTPSASGASVVSQHLVGECLYVTLNAETTSTVQVQWTLLPPLPPVVTSSDYISNSSEAHWVEPAHASGVVEYQYAVGTTPGGTDAQDWTSAGTSTSVVLSQANLQHGQTYYVSAKARFSATSWSEAGISGPLVADLTPPSSPSVTDDGAVQAWPEGLHAWWSAVDPESGVVEYRYAIGTQPGATDVGDWEHTTATEVNVDLELAEGQTYYFSVQARNAANLWSAIGVSDGIVVAYQMSVGAARGSADGTPVSLTQGIVTAVFPGEFYVESPDRSAGIKVVSVVSVQEQDKVYVAGFVSSDSTERIVADASVTVTGSGTIEPLFLTNSALGGSGDSVVPGASGAVGLNNVGLLIRTSGRIILVGTDYIYIDDGSKVDAASGQIGVKVSVSAPHTFQVASYALVTGISALETDGPEFRRLIRTRRNSDVTVFLP